MNIIHEKRFRIVALVSVAVTLAACAALIIFAEKQGLNPLHLTGDSKGYVLLAENMRAHGVFSVATSAPFYPESFRAPGYPAFLALIFSIVGVSYAALFVHALIVSSAPMLLYLLVRPFHERAAFWASILFACEPVRLYLSASFLSDAFFTVVFLASLLCLMHTSHSYRAVLASGILLGIAILVRPIAIFLPLVYSAYLLAMGTFSRTSIIAASLLCTSSLLVIGPWMYRNHITFDSWSISSVGAANLMLYNAPEFLKWHSDEKSEALLDSFRNEQAALPREEALSLTRNSVFTETFREIIRGKELSYTFFHLVKTIPFFVTDGLRDTIRLFGVDVGAIPNISTALMRLDFPLLVTYVMGGGLAVTLFLVGTGFWGVVTLLFGFETMRSIMRREWSSLLFLSALVVYFALLTGPVSNARYRVPIEGFLLFVAVMAAIWWYDRVHATLE